MLHERVNVGWYDDPPHDGCDGYGVSYIDLGGKRCVRWYKDKHIARGALTQLRKYYSDCMLVRHRA